MVRGMHLAHGPPVENPNRNYNEDKIIAVECHHNFKIKTVYILGVLTRNQLSRTLV